MTSENSITLGSLFDGIGAFPYAASFFGITPLWASEILPNPVSITKKHFPNMTHLGDITKLDGGKIPPVDILCFGSPCQTFSIAGPRTGFEGKSGLFFEAIRIIQEMRSATNGNYPKIAIFENVPGVLNIDRGRSYKTIIEAFCETEVSMPASGRWANAGMVRGGSVDFAWVVKDAQHYRVPQRRKRLFAVADFTGRRAAEILFKSESLHGYFAARELARKGTPADAESGVGSEGDGVRAYGETGRGYWQDGVQTLRANGENHPTYPSNVVVNCAVAYCLQGNMIGRADKNGPQGNGVNENVCYSLTATDHHAIASVDCRNLSENGEVSGTLQSKCGGGYSLNYQNPVRTGYVIRRLTPIECERLMAFDDGYTAIGHDGKVMSDSARYQMLGNSIVVNVLAYIMQNIAKQLNRDLER